MSMSMDPRLLEVLKAGDTVRLRALIIENSPSCLYGITVQKNTSLHIAAGLGQGLSVAEIASHCPTLLATTNSKGDTPIHCAARAGHEFTVSFLVGLAKSRAADTSVLRARNGCGDTALHEAVRHRHGRAVRELIIAERQLAAMANGLGESPLYLAAERGSREITELLLGCSYADFSGPNGQTALHAAVCRSSEIAQLLLDRKPELSRGVDESQSTPLHYAVSVGDQSMVKILLEHDASAAHLLDKDGLSPIHIAASMGHVDIIMEIIHYCPDAIELTENNGKNFLHVAAEKKRSSVVKFVLRTPTLRELINEKDDDGNTPLHLATITHKKEIVHLFLADKRVDATARNHEGLTPLDLASTCGDSSTRLRMHKIMVELASAGSQFSPQRMDFIKNRLRRRQEEEINRYRALANNLAVVAVLIATVTFAAAFTLPGGYKNDPGPEQGLAVLTKKAAFKVFLISDAIAMLSSIIVTCLLIYTGSLDHDVRLHSIRTAMKFMCAALAGMVVAFAMGVYVVVVSDCMWLAILICAMACSVPFVAWAITSWPVFDLFVPVKAIRNQGARGGAMKRNMSRVLDFQVPSGTVVDFETPHNSKSLPLSRAL